MKTFKRLIVVLSVSVVLCGGLGYWLILSKADRDLERLLNGSPEIAIDNIVIAGQGKRIVIENANATAYLTQAFRSAKNEYAPSGAISYYCTVSFRDTWGTAECSLGIATDRRTITIDVPRGIDDPKPYTFMCTDPIPEELSSWLDELSAR